MYYLGKYDYCNGLIELFSNPDTGEPMAYMYRDEAEEAASMVGGEVMDEDYLIMMGVLD